jgi:hypothetical protein
MKPSKKLFVTALALALTAGAWAENPAGPGPGAKDAAAAPAPAPVPAVITAADVQALKDALAAQQLQIQRLEQQLQRQQEQQAAAKTATVDTGAAPQQMAAVTTPATPQQNQDTTPGQNMQSETSAHDENPMHGPLSIHFRGITITPGGFAEAAFVRRQRALGADLTTPFNSLTMPGASQSNMSEFFGSARQSRPTVYVDGRLKNVELSSYISGDFLSSADTSSATQTNSYSFRLRQVWGQAKFDNGWSFLGGQMWSLVTENKAGIAPSDDTGRTNDSRPMTIDPGYNVGFSFARQYGIRLTKDFNHKLAVAVALENPQGTLTTHNNIDNFLLGSPGATNSYNDAITGCSTGTYTATGATSPTYYTTCTAAATYTFNPSPDLIAKVAIDPGFGHYEVFGLWDRFRDRVFPCENFVLGTSGPCPNNPAVTGPSANGAFNVSQNAGGGGANARWTFFDKHIVFGLHGLAGRGIGRYGAGQLSDLAIHADGSPNAIKNAQGLATIEWHDKKLDVYGYAGTEYDARTTDYDLVTGKYVGYGAPQFSNVGCYSETGPSLGLTNGFNPGSLADCTADTRALTEGSIGFWYRFYTGPRGRFQFGTQYSYITRQTWSGVGFAGKTGPGVSPEGVEGEFFTSFRYYLP